jgi:hypothetical protein
MTRLTNPQPLWLNARGSLIDAGYIYVGQAGGDPETQPIQVYFDAEMTIPAPQPLRTLGGAIVNGAYPTSVFFPEADASVRVEDADSNLIAYYPSLAVDQAEYQPLDSDLSAIAALSTTAFGRQLLTVANAEGLASATGVAAALPLAGGAVTGNITRQGAGAHIYWSDPAMSSGRVFLTASTAPDPTSQPGDVWIKYVA